MHTQDKIIIVDNDLTSSYVFELIFKKFGCQTLVFHNEHEAVEYLSSNPFDIAMVLTDYHLYDLNGLDICQLAKNTNSNILTTIISGDLRLAEIDFTHPDVDHFIPKPYSIENLKVLIEKIQHHAVKN